MNNDQLERVRDTAGRLHKYFKHCSRMLLRLEGDGDDPTKWHPVSDAGMGMTGGRTRCGSRRRARRESFVSRLDRDPVLQHHRARGFRVPSIDVVNSLLDERL